MDRNFAATKSGAGSNKLDKSPTPTLADYQAQWAKIHNDTIRQIKQAQGMQTQLQRVIRRRY
ncbi:uncharacterized protein BO72DRAFT_452490 [Aspergillus fijiensis CBS 313.89]|uniref:Uncharacterized protein n=1 Tax=Aspergillus fijiensis CBS 313.89 TaxID=1448319 RepID=A0A8G1RGX7_9EURO|nr:uncharacterized protein BO72DRAFT_452490 [Aspergillus fijiensis CBS 313.89]RAK72644.1 hypothetical protein BO72DRAFT_452490 [Aspergillus fijiensis CBS 313.89]